MKKVTIGIPVYNDSSTIGKCLESVLSQTFREKNMEIIISDDGSTDDTATIIRAYRSKARMRIKYQCHEHTGNPCMSRNQIIDASRSDYIFFVDGDDYLGQEAVERMYDRAVRDDADIVIGRYKGVGRGVPVAMFEDKHLGDTFFNSKVVDSMNALKMFRRRLLLENDIRFNPDLTHAEDHPFTMKAYLNASRISIVNDYDCYYWVRFDLESRIQLTKAPVSVEAIYAYISETLAVIASSRLNETEKKQAFSIYWHRLLYLDLPKEFKRKRSEEQLHRSFQLLKKLIDEYLDEEILPFLKPKEQFFIKLVKIDRFDLFKDFIHLYL